MFENLERQVQEKELEEKQIGDEMLHDEELALARKKEILESEIKEIKLQLMDNKEKELRAKNGEDVQPRNEIWVLKARKALLIKKSQLKKINKKLTKKESESTKNDRKKLRFLRRIRSHRRWRNQ